MNEKIKTVKKVDNRTGEEHQPSPESIAIQKNCDKISQILKDGHKPMGLIVMGLVRNECTDGSFKDYDESIRYIYGDKRLIVQSIFNAIDNDEEIRQFIEIADDILKNKEKNGK